MNKQKFDDPKIWVTRKLINKKPLISNLHKTSTRLVTCCTFFHSNFNNFSLFEGITSLDDVRGLITSARESESASKPNASESDKSWKRCRSTTNCLTRRTRVKKKKKTISISSEKKKFLAKRRKSLSKNLIDLLKSFYIAFFINKKYVFFAIIL